MIFFLLLFLIFFARKRVRRRPLERWVFMSDHKITGNKSQQHGIRLSAPPSQKKRRINKQSLLRIDERTRMATQSTASEGKNIDNNTHREKNRREPKMKTDR
jgi:hypothetical protein